MQKQQLIFFQSQAGERAPVIVRELDLKHARIEQFYDCSHIRLRVKLPDTEKLVNVSPENVLCNEDD